MLIIIADSIKSATVDKSIQDLHDYFKNLSNADYDINEDLQLPDLEDQAFL